MGTIEFFLGKEKLGEYKLTAPEDIKKMNLWDAILKLFGCFKKTDKDVKIEDRAKEKVTESVTEKATEAETEKKKEEKSKKKESAETTEKETKKAQESAEKKKIRQRTLTEKRNSPS